MKKVVVLNSGGFDSSVLINDVCNLFEDENTDIYSLHFLYGAPNEREQKKCVKKMCDRLGVENVVIRLPKIKWSKSKFYNIKATDYESNYLEYRNLIFLSYAVSFAQSIGADRIYLAILKSHGYCDTSKQFIDGLNMSIKQSGIEIVAPYSDKIKPNLWSKAKFYGIGLDDFISCDNHRCGKCADCLDTKGYEEFIRVDNTRKAFAEYDTINSQEFRTIYMNTPIEEVRLLINNDCQLQCKHCFYGFNEMKSSPLSFEKMCSVIDEAVALGVSSFHFAGKEPLINADIFKYADYIRINYPHVIFDVVTNGLTIPKFADDLVLHGFERVCLSVDDIHDSNGVRSVQGVSAHALSALCGKDIDVEVFIDIHRNNVYLVRCIIEEINNTYGVTRFFVRTIRNLKQGDDIHVSLEDLNALYLDLYDLAEENPNIYITFNIGNEYSYQIYRDKTTDLYAMCYFIDRSGSDNVTKNFILDFERFCHKFERQITVTPDGYVLGCGMEMSCKDYDKLSAGNVKSLSLATLIKIGKSKSYDSQCDKCVIDSGKFIIKNCLHSEVSG